MGRKKSEFSESSSKDKSHSFDEELSTTEEFDADGDAMEADPLKKMDSDPRTSSEVGAHVVVLPVKRGRGRPRRLDKIPIKLEAGQDDSMIKRKRGRPRKYSLPNGPAKVPKVPRKSIPRILLNTFAEKNYPRKRRGRPRKHPLLLTSSERAKARSNESRLGSQLDRLSSLLDRFENRINLDGLIDEDMDIESEQEIFLLQRNFNVKLDFKKEFKILVKSYLEELGNVQACLIASVRSYKDSGKMILYEIWHSEYEQIQFSKISCNKILDKDNSEMLKNTTVVKNMSIPAIMEPFISFTDYHANLFGNPLSKETVKQLKKARWWQRTR